MFMYAGGCSMTFGSEMFGPNDSKVLLNPELNALRRKHAWPGVLSELMGFDGHYNDGHGGASNERIMRNAMMWILTQWVQDDRSNDELYVHINWSQTTRWEVYHDDRFDSIFVNLPPDVLSHRTKEFARFWLMYQDHCADLAACWQKFVHQVIAMQAFLEARGIKYGMSYGVSSPIGNLRRSLDLSASDHTMMLINSTKAMNRGKFFNLLSDSSGMADVLQRDGIHDKAPRGHPLQNGHAHWAKCLAEWIEVRGIL